MNKATFLIELARQLESIYSASKAGLKPDLKARHRCEGFMQAGEFLKLVTREELSGQMELSHQNIFGESIADRKARQNRSQKWSAETIDYSKYESPTFGRNS